MSYLMAFNWQGWKLCAEQVKFKRQGLQDWAKYTGRLWFQQFCCKMCLFVTLVCTCMCTHAHTHMFSFKV